MKVQYNKLYDIQFKLQYKILVQIQYELGIMGTSILDKLNQHKMIAILRGVPVEQTADVAQALYDGGIRLLEITFNQKSATKLDDTKAAIRAVKERLGDKMTIGAGTVMSVDEVHAAKEAGVEFALVPNVDEEVIKEIVNCGMEAIPGAMPLPKLQIPTNGTHL